MPSALARQITSGAVLLLIVCASATQTEVANYLTAERGYSKPYLTFYLTHSTFSVIFPLHLLVLKLLRPKVPPKSYVQAIFKVVTHQLSEDGTTQAAALRKLGLTILGLTTLISIPALCWFCAVPLTGVTDLTALYSTATFFTYGFSLLLLRTPLSRTILSAIVVAFLGVLLITFSGVQADDAARDRPATPSEPAAPPHRILGDLIMLVGAAVLGLYEVIYKLSLPEGHGGVSSAEKDGEASGIPITAYSAVHQADGEEPNPFEIPPSRRPDGSHRRSSSRVLLSPRILDSARLVKDPSHALPLGLHANFLTSCIGLATLAIFWIPLPFLHWTGVEEMVWPGGSWPYIGTICMAGATYNAGFMCLIGLLGPVTASVANLLAIGLVALVDALYLGRRIPLWTLAGAGLVGLGFGVLLWAGEGEPEEAGADDGASDGEGDEDERIAGDGADGDPPWDGERRRSSSSRVSV